MLFDTSRLYVCSLLDGEEDLPQEDDYALSHK